MEMRKFTIEIKWGFVLIVFFLLWMLLEKQLGFHDVNIKWQLFFTLLIIFPNFIIYFLALWEKKNKYYNGEMNWTQGFISAMIISVITVIFSPITQFITHEFITPNYFDTIINYTVENKRLTLDAAKDNFNLTSYIWQNISGGLSSGLVIGAIVAYFIRTKKQQE